MARVHGFDSRLCHLVFLLHFTFKLIIVFVVFLVGRLDQLNYTFSIFFVGRVGLGFSIRVSVAV